jgi:hypothetical protein
MQKTNTNIPIVETTSLWDKLSVRHFVHHVYIPIMSHAVSKVSKTHP